MVQPLKAHRLDSKAVDGDLMTEQNRKYILKELTDQKTQSSLSGINTDLSVLRRGTSSPHVTALIPPARFKAGAMLSQCL
jgi:hypothetical protein